MPTPDQTYYANNRERRLQEAKDYHAANREKISARLAQKKLEEQERRFGVKYAVVLAVQGGRCAACRTTKPGGRYGRFCFDHDHKTGKFRGLLCLRCNTAVGHAGDDPEVLRALADYVERSTPHDP